ncbi:MAG: hypothetical protein RL755_49 [Pseudomonadota bacterium]|jgi:hypothetical protein
MDNLDDVIGEFDAGIFSAKVLAAMSQVALGAVECGKKGKVTIEFVFDAKLASTGVNIQHTLKYAKPTNNGDSSEKSTTSTYMYVGKRGVLTISPEQQDDVFSKDGNVTKLKGLN